MTELCCLPSSFKTPVIELLMLDLKDKSVLFHLIPFAAVMLDTVQHV